MMPKRSMVRKLALLFALLIALVSALPAQALISVPTRTVRVGFYHIEGYQVMDEDGRRSGYGYEVLQAMKLYANWNYAYIGYDKGWADMQQMLLDGELDMVISAVKTEERAKSFDFSGLPVSQSGACLIVKAGESPYIAGQYDTYNGMRVGFIENASQIAKMADFAKEKGFAYTPVYYKTSDELEAAVLRGEDVDAIVTSNMRIIANTRRLELFAMQDVHAMVRKGDTALLSEIDYALAQISLNSPKLYDQLYNKYYSVDTGDTVFFSPEESAFISACQNEGTVLRAVLMPDKSPYVFDRDGEASGILYDLSAEILRRTGLSYEIVPTHTAKEYLDLVSSGFVDLCLTMPRDLYDAETMGYTLTDAYYTTDVSKLARKDGGGAQKTVAVVEGGTIDTKYLPALLADEEVLRLATISDCVDAVLSGRCGSAYLYTRAAQEATYLDETNSLTSAIIPGYAIDISIGVNAGADARLASILEKATNSLSEDDIAKLELKYTDYPARQTSLRGLLYSSPLIMLALVVLLLIVIFTGLMLLFSARKRAQEKEKNRLLQAALDSAKQANAAKSVFMSRMSHEIRTPLNAIIGYNSISSNTLSTAKTETEFRQAVMSVMDYLTKSDVASRHLLTVINDVLDMSAIESGRIKIASEPFDFKSTVSELTVMFYSQASAKNIRFEVTFDAPTEEWFMGDQMRLSQILTNLLSNAIKFTPAGGDVRLKICETQQSEDSARVHFEVSDTGIGMNDDFLANVFTPFEQADASISRRFGGTGLGLSITKNLVDMMGGEITVRSQLGAGSTFTVDLTLKRVVQTTREDAYDFSQIYALIVDDDASTCEYLKLLFGRYGVRCAAVTGGEAAVAAVAAGIEKKDRFSLCVVDWQMPGMDGKETIRRIKELNGSQTPVIIISAYDYAEIEHGARDVGVETFIAKPLFPSTVFDLLVTITGRHSAAPKPVKKATHDFHGARVLLAEDNVTNIEIAKRYLTYWNLSVDEAVNGLEAVERYQAAPEGTYRVILMDVHMPEMDGYRATQKIRASGRADAETVPIIALTADVFADDVSEAMAAGMNGHIGKPIDMKQLLSTLQTYIKS